MLTIAGLIQGQAWYNGEVVVRVLPEIHPYMILRLALGLSIISGAVIGLYNLVMTLRPRRSVRAGVGAGGLLRVKMTPALLVIGGLLVFWASISIMVVHARADRSTRCRRTSGGR